MTFYYKVITIFDIENKGKGAVFSKDAFGSKACIADQEKDKENRINVKVTSTADIGIKCGKLNDKAEGIIRLVEGKTSVTCNIDTSRLSETTFENPLKISLDYVYKEDVRKAVLVQNAI